MFRRRIQFRWPFLSKRDIRASIDEELEFHLATRTEELVRAGASPAEARRLAVAEFGDVAGTRAYCQSEDLSMERTSRRREYLGEIIQDLRYGARSLRRQPGFAFAAVVTLALGVGANTAVFGIIHGVLLSPLPYRAPDELVAIAQGMRGQAPRSAVSPPNYLDVRSETKGLADAGAYYPSSVTLTGRGEPVRVAAPVVTPSLLSTLGEAPFLGRGFTPGEGAPGQDKVAILSHGFWLRHFGGERSALGAAIRLDGETYTIVGVMPKGFSFPVGESDLWLPLGWDARVATQRGAQYLYLVGRQRPAAPIAGLRAELETLARRLEASYPSHNLDLMLGATPLTEQIVGDSRAVLLLLAGAVSLVILIASSNVANLLLARVTRRSGEFAVRAALGAGRARLLRQLAAESLLLGACGAVGGLAVGWSGLTALKTWWPEVIPRQQDIAINLTVAGFALGIALVASLLAALVPSWRMSWAGISGGFRRGTRGDGVKGNRLRHALVTAELALALMLLTGATLLLNTIRGLEDTDPGFERRNLVTFDLSLPAARYTDGAAISRFFDAALGRIRGLPGVTGADAIFGLPVSDASFRGTFKVEGPPTVAGDENDIGTQIRIVTTDYFRTMGIPVREGRSFGAGDRRGAPRVLIVSASVARHFWPDGDAIGHRLRVHASPGPDKIEGEIVGVVGDVRAAGLHRPPISIIYSPLEQTGVTEMSVVIRSAGPDAAVIPYARDLIRSIDPEILVERAATMDEVIARSLGRPRFAMEVLGLFSVLGVVLAVVGIYGVVAYSVGQRTQEIGVRMALGADPRKLVLGVVGHELVFVALGVGAGGLAMAGLTPLLSKVVFGLDPAAPSVIVAMAGLLFLVAALAVFVPARRAARIDPVTAIRTE